MHYNLYKFSDLWGAIDNILKKGDKLIVLDYKTRGYPLKDDTADHYQDQMDIYNLLLRKNNYNTEDYAYLLFYYPNKVNNKGDVDFHAELVKMEISIENAENIFKKAKEVLEGKIPESKEDCEYCKFKENAE
jgi:CRISPR/Cas system-associated exonuclease Cas4 (RecB family)